MSASNFEERKKRYRDRRDIDFYKWVGATNKPVSREAIRRVEYRAPPTANQIHDLFRHQIHSPFSRVWDGARKFEGINQKFNKYGLDNNIELIRRILLRKDGPFGNIKADDIVNIICEYVGQREVTNLGEKKIYVRGMELTVFGVSK